MKILVTVCDGLTLNFKFIFTITLSIAWLNKFLFISAVFLQILPRKTPGKLSNSENIGSLKNLRRIIIVFFTE